jgi:hypothetical protein
MSWPPVAADLYAHGPPASFWTGVPGGSISAALSRAVGKLSRKVGPRAGGPASEWTWTDAAGQEDATGDVCTVAASYLALQFGLILPGEGTDPAWLTKAAEIEKLWSRMGTPGGRDNASSEPLYAGLADATPDTTEGAARGWSTASPYEGTEDAA